MDQSHLAGRPLPSRAPRPADVSSSISKRSGYESASYPYSDEQYERRRTPRVVVTPSVGLLLHRRVTRAV